MRAGLPSFQLPQVKYDTVILGGGLDQVSPTLSLRSGRVRDAVNWECSITGGYTRVAGYERFDGRAAPSDATYITMQVTITGSLVVGQTITGASSAATGVIIAITDTTLALTKVTGVFTVGEFLKVSGVTQATYIASGSGFAITALINAQYLALAAEVYRPDIQAVPGSGPIRGVVYYNDVVYAWRDNAGATAMDVYKSSSSGWVNIPLGYELRFSSGLAAGILEGDTVTGLTSGASAVVKRVVVESGTFAANSAAGRLIFASVTGTFASAETLRVSGTNRATCTAAQSAITLLPAGRVQSAQFNFGGGRRVYGCDGKNRGFEFDGAVYVPIKTGMANDVPTNVVCHKNHLFFSFGASNQHSGITNPYQWSVVVGAGEFLVDGDVTAYVTLASDQTTAALAIYTDTSTFVLYGSSSSDFDLKPFETEGSGAKQYSGQRLGSAYVLDNKGVMSLEATQKYGNFSSSSLTLNIRPFIQQRRNLVTGSVVNHEKGQYRVFFSDGYVLYMTLVNGKLVGSMPVLLTNAATCVCQGASTSNGETAFFGGSNGYVYQLELGTSFDGQPIGHSLRLVWNSAGSPRIVKHWRRASVEVNGTSYAEFSFGYQLAYSSSDIDQSIDAQTVATNTAAPNWDGFTWDNFYWDGRTLSPSEVKLDGNGENIEIAISGNSTVFDAFTLNSIILHYSMRRAIR